MHLAPRSWWALAARSLLKTMDALEWLAAQPLAAVSLQRPVWTLLALQLGALCLLVPALPARRVGFALLAMPVLLWRAPVLAPRAVELTLLDVGQGLAAVVRTRHHVLIYDTGPRYGHTTDAGAHVVLPYLRTAGVAKVDLIVLSHGDLDHRGGLPSVRTAFPDADVLAGGRGKVPGAARCEAGRRWEWDGVRFEILHPVVGDWSENDASCVLRVRTGRGLAQRALLLTGDVQQAAEQQLVRRYGRSLAAHVLVAPHHGSRTSSSPAFVQAVAPGARVVRGGVRQSLGVSGARSTPTLASARECAVRHGHWRRARRALAPGPGHDAARRALASRLLETTVRRRALPSSMTYHRDVYLQPGELARACSRS